MAAVCTVHLLSPVEIGNTFVISGILDIDWKCFKIQLIRDNEGGEISLSIDVNRNSLKLSSLINHKVLGEQNVQCDSLAQNLSFKFYLLTFDEKFNIAMDDQFLCFYRFQTKLSTIKAIKVMGDVIKVKQVDHRSVYPVVCPQLQYDVPTVSFSSDIPCLFEESTVIIIRAILRGNSETGAFFIRFSQQGLKKQLFHFNPRFDERCIVVNSMNDSHEWQSEERFHQGAHNFPFKIDKEFQLAIFLDEDRFRVAKDGNHLLNYPFKTVQSTQLRVSNAHSIYEKLTGFKIFAKNGLDINVSYVDYFPIKQNDSKFYEMFSNMNFI